jgi:TetR/AcrR family transcriptional regulator, transcriptional repressor of bet genes
MAKPLGAVSLPHKPGQEKVGEKLLRLRQRQKLIDACITALHLHGPSRTTIDKVVAIADMSPGIVNFYFQTKAALLVAALDFLADEFEAQVLAPLAAMRHNPVLALTELVRLYLDPEIASPRKVSVWYAFWGEASSRREYYAICGKRDEAFAGLVRELIAQLIVQSHAPHLNADAIALGLIGCLEMIWQDIAIRGETEIDRQTARGRCQDYLRSIFPDQFGRVQTLEHAPPASSTLLPPGPVQVISPPEQRTPAYVRTGSVMLVASELTLGGIPAAPAPANNAGYDIVAQPGDRALQRVAVVCMPADQKQLTLEQTEGAFEWIAIVQWNGGNQPQRRIFIAPSSELTGAAANIRVRAKAAAPCVLERDDERLRRFENNFMLLAPRA